MKAEDRVRAMRAPAAGVKDVSHARRLRGVMSVRTALGNAALKRFEQLRKLRAVRGRHEA